MNGDVDENMFVTRNEFQSKSANTQRLLRESESKHSLTKIGQRKEKIFS